MKAIKVLIIDREREFTSILTDRLNSWGFAATAAENGEEALEQLESAHPEVAVLSLEARDSSGFDILNSLKARNPAIQVILLAGKGAALAGMSGIERGAFDVLPQPIELGVLIDAIRRAYRSRRGR
jgi:DNA-binding NtrC family response regulator